MDAPLAATLGVPLITGALTLVVCLVNNHYQNNTTRSLIEYRLKKLEEKVDKHNGVIDRTYELEKLMELQEEKIKVANNRIKDIEEKEKN
ncbi:MAG: hypothetical protein ACERKN_01435 [Velocimicrobium sp.]